MLPKPVLNIDAPDDVAEQLTEIALALHARWHLSAAHAVSVVEQWVGDDDLRAESNWVYLHETPEHWAGLLFHHFVLHDDGPCGDECRVEAWRLMRHGRRPIEPGAVLLLATPTTSAGELLAGAAARRGVEVRRVAGPEDLSGLAGRAAHWYGGPHAAGRVAGRVGIGLLEPDDGWLAELGGRYTGRRIEAATLADAWALQAPAFVKPPSDKSFPAQVYRDGSQLRRQSGTLPPDTPVLISGLMDFAAEYRLFLLDGEVAAASRYAVGGRLDAAPLAGDAREREVLAFASTLISGLRLSLPSAVVVDVGIGSVPDTGRERLAVVEANMAWFAHCYAADPDRVLEVVLRSAGPLRDVSAADFGYLRAQA